MQNKIENENENENVRELKNMQQNILQKLEKLSQLSSDYRNKQEKLFLGTFLNIMNKMSNELASANEQFQNIDRQIEKDEKCIELSMKLNFFQNQCVALKDQLSKTEQKLLEQKDRQKQLMKQKQMLQANLFKKSKQLHMYKVRALSFAKLQKSDMSDQRGNSKFFTMATEVESPTKSSYKRHSMSETKNTQPSEPQKIRQNENSMKSPQNQFRIKAAKMAKERKMIMNRTHYPNSNSNINHPRKNNLLTELLK